MDPLTALEIADGLLTLMQKLAPTIEEGLRTGTISTETQKATASRALAACAPASFIGPQWQPSDEAPAQPSGATGFAVQPEHPRANPGQPGS